MITGSFDQYGRPYIQGRLFFPRLKVDGYVEFLVDSGADVTTLHPSEAIQMRLPYKRLRLGSPQIGIGGVQAAYMESGLLVFADGSKLVIYWNQIHIPAPNENNIRLPSLLGQDILENWRMVHDKPREILTFTVANSHATVHGGMDDLPSYSD